MQDLPDTRKILLFGGSFNPVHKGHIAIANYARQQVHAKYVLFIPSSLPFFEKFQIQEAAHHRVAMLKKALYSLPWAQICLHEVEKEIAGLETPTHHYTTDTLDYLENDSIVTETPFLLIGDDILPYFQEWKHSDHLIDRVHLIVSIRYTPSLSLSDLPRNTILLHNPQYHVSSSEIRHNIQCHIPYHDLVTPEVYDYIERNHIYHTKN